MQDSSSAGGENDQIMAATHSHSVAVSRSAGSPSSVVFGDNTLFDYLGHYSSVSDMLEGSNNNQDWLDFVNLAAGNFQLSQGHDRTQLDNYSFHFLDNFTKRSGLVDSFDCGTHAQRAQVVTSFLENEGHAPALQSPIPLLANPSISRMPDLHDPLIIQTHKILLNIKEVVTVKPRNSVVELEWSAILEQKCMQFFSPYNIRKFLTLYWHIWHPNVNFVHLPTFEPTTAKSILVTTMALIGAKETVFTDDDFCRDLLDCHGNATLDLNVHISRIQALQAAYMVCLYQGWEGTEFIEINIADVPQMARDLGIMSARHLDYSTVPYESFDWKAFATREQLIRYCHLVFLWIYLLDHAFVIFNNLPPRMVIKEMAMHMASPESAFQATSGSDCAQELFAWHSRSAPIRNITFREVVESFCKSSIREGMQQRFADLGPLNLFAVVSAFHALIFQHQNSFGGHDQLQSVYNALNNWKLVWETYSDDFSFSSPHATVNKQDISMGDLWKRVGFMRHSPEYWLLAKLLVDRLSSPVDRILGSDSAHLET
ncbi:hypothetical protein ACLX1H_004829 [Fusarium chlamydosporum]